MPALLELRNVSKSFPDQETHVLRGINLVLSPGELVMVAGGNGSGKSTLMRIIAGDLRPDQGGVLINGREVTAWPAHRRARYIGRVFQDPCQGTAATLTVAENLAFAGRRGIRHGLGRALSAHHLADYHARLRSLDMGLEAWMHTPIQRLSGGQRQAVTLLMAIWPRPDLLLLDEPTAALDPQSADQVIQLIMHVVAEHHLTTLWVTHSMSHAAHYGDRLLMLHRGTVARVVEGLGKRHLEPHDLLKFFDAWHRRDRLDEACSQALQRLYI